jgi:BsuBI/PstI restriction endonuclease domain/BsuBI/PstI restriction endonuclease HTH domain
MMELLAWPEIQRRLREIFPEGTPHRNYCIWEIAAKTIFVMIYVDAVEGGDSWLRPDQVRRMTDVQAQLSDEANRRAWTEYSVKPSKSDIPGSWYAVNTRESIRDDTIRNALVANGAIVEREGLPTTSPAGRYALQTDFAKLFHPKLSDPDLQDAILAWQDKHLNAGARMRIAVMRKGAMAGGDRILVTFPSGETQRMAPGPSSELSRAVIEVFAPRFLKVPAVIFLSESRDKVVARHEDLARQIGINILADKNLPDIMLADLEPEYPRLVFVEIVASDGPVSEQRKSALLELTDRAGFPRKHVAFVTAYMDRSRIEFKKTVDVLAWGSMAWFASEPDNLLHFESDARLGWMNCRQ